MMSSRGNVLLGLSTGGVMMMTRFVLVLSAAAAVAKTAVAAALWLGCLAGTVHKHMCKGRSTRKRLNNKCSHSYR